MRPADNREIQVRLLAVRPLPCGVSGNMADFESVVAGSIPAGASKKLWLRSSTAEQLAFNQLAVGAAPTGVTIKLSCCVEKPSGRDDRVGLLRLKDRRGSVP
jgi:hypothetical protein